MTVRRLADGSWESIATREATEDMNLPKMLHQRVASHPGQVAIERRSNVGAWRRVTMETFLGEADSIARGLIGIGLEAGDHLAILAPTSYEWALIDVAALSCGAITVPIYETDSARRSPISSQTPTCASSSLPPRSRPSWSSPCAPTACAISSPWTAVPSAS